VVIQMPVSPAERTALALSRPNTMLIGPPEAVRAVLTDLLPSLRQPVCWWRLNHHDEPLPGECATLIVHEASELTAQAQSALLAWLMARRHEAQVITVSSRPILPSVQAGRFAPDLYYALNTFYFVLPDEDGVRS
jgi:hypothetical protein